MSTLSSVLLQGESELVAKEDNLDTADSNRDKKSQDQDEEQREEETEKIHEQGDEVTSHPLQLFTTSCFCLPCRLHIRTGESVRQKYDKINQFVVFKMVADKNFKTFVRSPEVSSFLKAQDNNSSPN